MGAQDPPEVMQRKAALFEVLKAPEELGTASRALPLASGSISPAVPKVGEELPLGPAGGPGVCAWPR